MCYASWAHVIGDKLLPFPLGPNAIRAINCLIAHLEEYTHGCIAALVGSLNPSRFGRTEEIGEMDIIFMLNGWAGAA